jgi:DNA cross-link repair 1A protein
LSLDIKSNTLSSNYFLTHFHSDHYGGITKQWNEGIIYCSAPTANLVNQQLGVEKRFLHPLPMNAPTVIASKDKPITVTLLDANHCPGAVMFLFEVGNKKILHVGDFRWNQSIMMAMPQLQAFSNMKPRLDEIFLDTTYCDPKYSLPTQDAAIAAAIKVVKEELSTAKMMGTKSLLLFGSYTIGKEKIYLSVAEYLKTKVYVDKRRYRILSALEWPKDRMDLFTTIKSESFLWVVPLGHVNFKKIPDYMEDGNKNKAAFAQPYGRVVGFRPTGWTFSTPKSSTNASPTKQRLISSKNSGRFSIHGVPYSEHSFFSRCSHFSFHPPNFSTLSPIQGEHSSFPELVNCLRCLKPKKITTTVSVSKSDEQCQMLLDAVNSSE